MIVAPFRHQRKRLLYCEEYAFHIDIEDRIIKLFTDLAKMGIFCDALHSRKRYRACPSPV